MQSDQLLNEAVEVARHMGCEVERRPLAGEGGDFAWRRNRKHVTLDSSQSADQQLATIAFALRGETHLANAPMRRELVEYLDVRRVA